MAAGEEIIPDRNSNGLPDWTQHAVLWRNGSVIDLGSAIPYERWDTPLGLDDRGDVLIQAYGERDRRVGEIDKNDPGYGVYVVPANGVESVPERSDGGGHYALRKESRKVGRWGSAAMNRLGDVVFEHSFDPAGGQSRDMPELRSAQVEGEMILVMSLDKSGSVLIDGNEYIMVHQRIRVQRHTPLIDKGGRLCGVSIALPSRFSGADIYAQAMNDSDAILVDVVRANGRNHVFVCTPAR